LGRYEVPVRMGDVSPVLHVVVLREEEVAAYLASKGLPAEAAATVSVTEEGSADTASATEVPADTTQTAE
jgi:hypothetical protein